jgi:hypothetical protein
LFVGLASVHVCYGLVDLFGVVKVCSFVYDFEVVVVSLDSVVGVSYALEVYEDIEDSGVDLPVSSYEPYVSTCLSEALPNIIFFKAV